MSRNGSGVYSLPAGNPVVTGTTISSSWANTTLSDIATALTGSVASDGQTAMTGNLQMGNNKVTGLAVATSSGDALSYGQAATVTDLSVTGNATVGGTLTLTGGLTLNGNVTVGDSSADTLTVNATSTFAAGATFSSTFAANGGVTLGDASGDALTINSSAVSIPNGLNFDSNTLVIDATNNRVGVGTASPEASLTIVNSVGNVLRIGSNQTLNTFKYSVIKNIAYNNNSGGVQLIGGKSDSSYSEVSIGGGVDGSYAATQLTFYTAANTTTADGSERMRIDSSGNVGIGTSSPAFKLDVVGTVQSNSALYIKKTGSDTFSSGPFLYFNSGDGSGNGSALQLNANNGLDFWNSTGGVWSKRMTLDSSGNLGLGVTPSAWGSSFKALQVGAVGSTYTSSAGDVIFGRNTYNNGTNSLYLTSSFASAYGMISGQHQWYTAPSGTAGNAISFTQAMTLDASGNLGIGTTSPAFRTDIINNATYQLRLATTTSNYASGGVYFGASGTSDPYYYGYVRWDQSVVGLRIGAQNGAGGNGIAFETNGGATSPTERMRIDSSGNVGIGTSSPAALLHLSQNGNTTAFISATNSGTNSAGLTLENAGQRNWNIWADRATDTFRIGNNSRATTNIALDSSGNLLVGLTSATSGGGVLQVSNGITFPATQSASSNANTLDDYEEGTWTPVLSGGAPTYSTQTGWYIKIGRIVHAWGQIEITNKSSSTTEAGISGLPFATSGGLVMSIGSLGRAYLPAGIAPASMNGAFFSVEGTNMWIRQPNGTGNNFTINDFTNSGSLWFGVTYQAGS